MNVVSDTSPLNYLILVSAAEVLGELFEAVLIPEAVRDELQAAESPEAVRAWWAAPPAWLLVLPNPPLQEDDLAGLHEGERAAILLAETQRIPLVLLDERAGRAAAEQRGFRVTGTLGLINVAGQRGLIHVPSVVRRLQKTTFRASSALYKWLLDQHAEGA